MSIESQHLWYPIVICICTLYCVWKSEIRFGFIFVNIKITYTLYWIILDIHYMCSFVEICYLLEHVERSTDSEAMDAMDADGSFSRSRGITENKNTCFTI